MLGSRDCGARGCSVTTRNETKAIGRTVYRDLADTCDIWFSISASPSNELWVARAVVPNRCKNVPMRVMNVAGYAVTLPVDAVLANLEAVEMVVDQSEPASANDEGRYTWFFTFDLWFEIRQVEMDLRVSDKTTFVTIRGTFRFKVMPSGLCTAPATFQLLMNVAMVELYPEVCLIYLDDIIVHSRDPDSHLPTSIGWGGYSSDWVGRG